MAKLLGAHWPHLAFVAVGVVVFLWTAYRPARGQQLDAAQAADPRRATPAPANVKRSAARAGLLALGPLVGTVATGAVLYGIDVGGGSVSGAVIWVHSGISALALLLVAYKVGDLGLARIRRAFGRERLPELVSIVLGVLSVPLALTGVALLLAPSTRSFFAYTHLISSAWWTGLLGWHLRRYLGASLRALTSGARRPSRPLGSEDRADLVLKGRDVPDQDLARPVGLAGVDRA
jgi:hypothetical protein